MRSHLTRRLGLTAVLALFLAVFGLAPAASASASLAPAELSFSTDAATTTPGGTVNLSMTLTNNKTHDIWFVYQTIDPTWLTTQRPDLKYSFSGCSLAGPGGSTPAPAPAPPTSAATTGPPCRPARAGP